MCIKSFMIYDKQAGVPAFESYEYENKNSDYVLLIPVINEGERILKELYRAFKHCIYDSVDIVICDGGSTDGSMDEKKLKKLKVNSLLIKKSPGNQGTQLRMGIWWALKRGYKGLITIDGNNKDSIEDVPKFIDKLKEGYDLVQGSRFIDNGRDINTPLGRYVAIKFIHAPITSLAAGFKYTDTTNAFRAYSSHYLCDKRVMPLRDIFVKYELLAYLSVRAPKLGLRVCEIPVTRAYPRKAAVPTKISPLKGNAELLVVLIKNLFGKYNP